MPALIIQTGKRRGQKLVLPDVEIVMGRDDKCQIRLASSDVSRRHCAIRPSPEGMLVRDLGSRNGTLVNDVVIEEETLLDPGDILRVGPMLFQVAGKKDVQEHSQAAQPQPDDTQPATDDNIASWLAVDEPGEDQGGPGDTTIVPNKPREEPAVQPDPKPAPKPARISPRRDFNTIAEEAADIIRRHWESVDEEKQTNRQP